MLRPVRATPCLTGVHSQPIKRLLAFLQTVNYDVSKVLCTTDIVTYSLVLSVLLS